MNNFRINTPLASSNSLRLLGQSQAQMETAIQRLSSGLRINSAKDDTAGSAISQRMQNQIRGQRMASNNIKQGTNLVQTAEGGLGEIQGILSRMRELAVQAASDNLNTNDRASINLEYQQLKQEVNRIANSTNYNSINLLDGSRGGSNGVGNTSDTGNNVGNNSSTAVTNITDLLTSDNGFVNSYSITLDNNKIYWGQLGANRTIQQSNLDGTDPSTVVEGVWMDYVTGMVVYEEKLYWTDLNSTQIKSVNLNDNTEITTHVSLQKGAIDLAIHDNQIYWVDRNDNGQGHKIRRSNLDGSYITDLVTDVSDVGGLTIHNNQLYWTDPGTDKIQRSNLDGTDITNLVTSDEGLERPLNLTIHNNQLYWADYNTNKIQRSNLDGTDITDLVTGDEGLINPRDLAIYNDQLYWVDMGTAKIQRADLNLEPGNGTSDFTLQIGANNSTNDRMTFGIDSVTTDSLLLANTDVDTLSDAQTTINSLDAAIDFINDQRSNLGAVQNRLGFADSNLMSSIQNTESSLSTIRDADFSLEASNLARTQILTQSGTANITEYTVSTEIAISQR